MVHFKKAFFRRCSVNFCGFSIASVRYPNPAEGWVDGVYRKRIPSKERADVLPADVGGADGGIVISCRHWREKEDSGWGVFDYVEAPEFSFASELSDYTLKARFYNPTGEEIPVRALADGVTVLYGAVLPPQAESELTFTTASVCETSKIVFFVPDENAAERDTAPCREIVLLSLEAELLPTREPTTKPTLFLASDSTVQTYDSYYYPQTGWGEVLYKYFKNPDFVCEYKPEGSSYSHCRAYELPQIIVENRAIGGRSSLSFYLEGKFAELLLRVKRGDTVLIQFGHNDATKARPNRYVSIAKYKECLRSFIRAIRARGAIAVLVTPVMRRSCDEERGTFNLSFPDHRNAMIELAEEESAILLDLGKRSHEICTEIGCDASKSLFLWTEAGKYSGAYKNGSTDSTHLQRRGALIFAGAVAELISHEPALSRIADLLDREKDFRKYYPNGVTEKI